MDPEAVFGGATYVDWRRAARAPPTVVVVVVVAGWMDGCASKGRGQKCAALLETQRGGGFRTYFHRIITHLHLHQDPGICICNSASVQKNRLFSAEVIYARSGRTSAAVVRLPLVCAFDMVGFECGVCVYVASQCVCVCRETGGGNEVDSCTGGAAGVSFCRLHRCLVACLR
ncbi:hypothetical protein PLESTM_001623400 [Pleodorina starrii]|nr:hypothetical protein PLESTM_001623400 [Pleodorina starrii]